MTNKTIIYVNFSPYENTGNILDYLLDNFQNVLLFSFNFHKLGRGKQVNKLLVYKKKRLVKTKNLYQVPLPQSMVFLFIPFRSAINVLQLVWNIYQLKKKFGHYDFYFTVNAFTAWVGNILQRVGVVEKTIFWVWDYYPPMHPNKIIVFMRSLYWQFDKMATKSSGKVVFLNKRLLQLRRDIGILPERQRFEIVPIGTKPLTKIHQKDKRKIVLSFIGVLKKSQGLDIFFDNADEIIKKFPSLELHIIGSGPDEKYFKDRARKTKITTNFYGLLDVNSKSAQNIFRIAKIGIAPYIPEEGNVSYFGDPSKIKNYLSFGLPVITTDVFEFSKEIEEKKAGIIIDYFTPKSFINALAKILDSYDMYAKNSLQLAKKYQYKKVYAKIFTT